MERLLYSRTALARTRTLSVNGSVNKGRASCGPKVRAAGRIVLLRDAGKLKFLDIQDWTGRIQLFIGKAQVGEQNWRWPIVSIWAIWSESTVNCGGRKRAS